MDMDLKGMKRRELQALCKKHGIPANLSNHEMANRLSLRLQEEEHKENEEDAKWKKAKKVVKFSPETETFLFQVDSESDSDDRSKRITRRAAKRKKLDHQHEPSDRLQRALRRSARLTNKPTTRSTPSLSITCPSSFGDQVQKDNDNTSAVEAKENVNIEGSVDDPLYNNNSLFTTCQDPEKFVTLSASSPDSHEGLKIDEPVTGKTMHTQSDTVDNQPADPDTQVGPCLVELDLDPARNSEPIQDSSTEFSENLDSQRNVEKVDDGGPIVSCDTNEEMVVEITPGDTSAVACKTSPDNQDEKTGQTTLKFEKDDIGDKVEPMSQSHFTLEMLSEGSVSETLSASNKIESVAFEVIKEWSEEVSQAALQMDQTDLDQIKSTFFIADDIEFVEDKANVADDTGKVDAGLYATDYSETERDDYDVEIAMLNQTQEDLMLPHVEIDATHISKKVDHEVEENANHQDADLSPEAKLSFDISSKSPEAYLRMGSGLNVSPPLGDKYGSQTFSEDTEKETSVEDKGNSVAAEDKSDSCGNSDKSSDVTNGPVMEHNGSTQEYIEELFGNHKDAKSVQSDDDLQGVGAFGRSCIRTPLRQNMDDDCFVPSPEFTNSEMNRSLQNDEEGDIKVLQEVFVKANMGRDAEENVIMDEDADLGFESQVNEHKHAEPSVSQEQISGNRENPSEQDDVSALIQEYMERETHMDEFVKMDSYATPCEESATCGLVEGAELSSIAKPAVKNTVSRWEEEVDAGHAIAGKSTKIEDLVSAGPGLSKINDVAQTDSIDDMSVNHEVSEMPNLEGIASHNSLNSEDSIEATENNESSYKASAKRTDSCEGAGVKVAGSFIIAGFRKDRVGKIESNKDASTFDAYPASDEPTTEAVGSTEKVERFGIAQHKSLEFENSVNSNESRGESLAASGEPITECGSDDAKQVERHSEEPSAVVGTPVSTKDDSADNISGTMELENIASIGNAEILDAALHEPGSGKEEVEEKHCVPSISQENVDYEKNKDYIMDLEKSLENTEIDGRNSSSEQVNNVDSEPNVEGFPFPAAQARQVKFEFVQENDSSKSLDDSADHLRKEISEHIIPETPKILHKVHDMKENQPNSKMEQFGSITASRKSSKRRPLEDLRKN